MKKSNFQKTLIILGYALVAVSIVLALIGLAQIDYKGFYDILVAEDAVNTVGTIGIKKALVGLNLWKAVPLLKASGIVSLVALIALGGAKVSSWFEKE